MGFSLSSFLDLPVCIFDLCLPKEKSVLILSKISVVHVQMLCSNIRYQTDTLARVRKMRSRLNWLKAELF